MLNTLIESGGRKRGVAGHVGWGVASTALHATLITAAVLATMSHRTTLTQSAPASTIIYVPARPATTTHRPAISVPTPPDQLRIPIPTIPDIPVPNPVGSFTPDSLLTPIGPTPVGSAPVGVEPGTSAPNGTLHDASTVDRAVVPQRGNPHPRYPRDLQSLGIEGDVIARFVVDTTGRVEPASFEVMSTSNRSFSDAVRDALMHSRFVPASAGGQTVRQLVEQRFSFSLRP